MSSFTQARWVPAGFKNDAGREMYRCVGGYYWELGWLGSGKRIEVEDGALSDGLSWPRWLKWLFGWMVDPSAWMDAAGIHDEMRRRPDLYSLIESDATFLMCMETSRLPPLQREFAFLMVRTNRSRANESQVIPL